MPPEPNRWTLDALREYLLAMIERNEEDHERRLHELEKLFDQRFAAQQRAVDLAASTAARALEVADAASKSEFRHVNEFRQLVEDIQDQQMPRAEIIQRLERLSEKIDKEVSRTDDASSRGIGLKAGWAIAVAVAMFAIAVASFFRR